VLPAPDWFFLAAPGGQRFCIHHRPAGRPRGAVVQVHAFAEEMNKCRRMAALQSRALAAAGFAVLQIDLYGCGDSSGDFGDASWRAWLDDVLLAAGWMARQHDAPLVLWGVRAGCLLAAQAGAELAVPAAALFWQPVIAGKTALQQFLRLALVGGLQSGSSPGLGAQLRQQLAAGASVEIAGYALSAALAGGLEAATLTAWPGALPSTWFEISTRDSTEPSPPLTAAAGRWAAAGSPCRVESIQGPAFWQTTEIEVAPALLSATVAAALRGTGA
jgi:uncharacterized protein